MKRNDIAQAVAKKTGLNINDVDLVITEVNKEVSKALAKGLKVFFRGFGSYGTKVVAPKAAYLFKTKETIRLPVSTKVYFKPSMKLAKVFKDKSAKDEDVKRLFDQKGQAA